MKWKWKKWRGNGIGEEIEWNEEDVEKEFINGNVREWNGMRRMWKGNLSMEM